MKVIFCDVDGVLNSDDFIDSVKTGKVIRDKNDKWRELTDNFKQNYRLTEIDKTVRIITSS